ncbi:MAG TPA: NepR family anti-sigma factor [Candidatus Sulfotelmatobacter sp.]|nr:NepR family anti-sigma factor [Candidatus Sulfotelmatobacter sp.]
MSSADSPDLRPARQEAAADKKKAKAGTVGDPLTEQLHELYDAVAREPIPESLLDLLRKMKS